jgi:hypothetical protein
MPDDAPKPEDFPPEGPPREPFMFDMMKGDDAGQGFPMVQLPPREEEPAPAPAPPRADERPRETAMDRRRQLEAKRRSRTRRGFLVGLLVGQALVLAVNLGVPQLAKLAPDRMRFESTMQLPLLVLLGVTAGIAFIAALIVLLLVVTGVVGLFTRGSIVRGMVRAGKAVVAIVLTTAVVGGTAFMMIPREHWRGVPAEAKRLGEKGWEQVRATFK